MKYTTATEVRKRQEEAVKKLADSYRILFALYKSTNDEGKKQIEKFLHDDSLKTERMFEGLMGFPNAKEQEMTEAEMTEVAERTIKNFSGVVRLICVSHKGSGLSNETKQHAEKYLNHLDLMVKDLIKKLLEGVT